MTPVQLKAFDDLCDRLRAFCQRWDVEQRQSEQESKLLWAVTNYHGFAHPEIRRRLQMMCDQVIIEHQHSSSAKRELADAASMIENVTRRADRRKRNMATR
jgi:hypothetical protein